GRTERRRGDAVFVMGNPGATSRLKAVSQLEYEHAVSVSAQVAFLDSRLRALHAFYDAHRATGDSLDMRNWMFGVSNSLKSSQGRLGALLDSAIMDRRRAIERELRDSLAAHKELRDRYGQVFSLLADVEKRKSALAAPHRAFAFFGNGFAGSTIARRALNAAQIAEATPDSARVFSRRAAQVGNLPHDLE